LDIFFLSYSHYLADLVASTWIHSISIDVNIMYVLFKKLNIDIWRNV
jgi:hypothetical protein